jgi:glycosyltransferase involved in cell wall biosynthesis
MRIFAISIPNHHFFQWVNQLENSGHEVIWFDASDGGAKVQRIKWVTQIKGWKLRLDFPFRQSIKKNYPKISKWLARFNEKDLAVVFEKLIDQFQPDVIHCFEMRLTGLPLIKVLQKHGSITLVYSSWGSDLYYFKALGVSQKRAYQFLQRVNYLITDCHRDYEIAKAIGFSNTFLGVYPGNGGIAIKHDYIKTREYRNQIIVKGYDDGVGKAHVTLQALKMVNKELLSPYELFVYSADEIIVQTIKMDLFFQALPCKVIPRGQFLANEKLLQIMGKAVLHIGNSISDGMPNALLEAMGMGAFPIQSNPGRVSEEVISDGKNGFLIQDPLDAAAIANQIESALLDVNLISNAMDYNIELIKQRYDRAMLKNNIIKMYNDIFDLKGQ